MKTVGRIMAALLASGWAMLSAATAAAQTPNSEVGASGLTRVERLLAPDVLTVAEVSPSGRYVAVVNRFSAHHQLQVYATAAAGPPVLTMQIFWAGNSQLYWKDDDRLVIDGNLIAGRESVRKDGAKMSDPEHWRGRYFGTAVINVGTGGVEAIIPRMTTAPQVLDLLVESAARPGARLVEAPVIRPSWLYTARMVSELKDSPDEVLLSVIARDVEFSLFRYNLRTKESVKVEDGSRWTVDWTVSPSGEAIGRIDRRGGWLYHFVKAPGTKDWKRFARTRYDEETDYQIVGQADEPGRLLVRARKKDADFTGLYLLNPATGEFERAIVEDPKADVTAAAMSWEGKLLYATVADHVLQYRFTDPKAQERWEALRKRFGSFVNVEVVSRSRDEQIWVILVEGGDAAPSWYMHDARTNEVRLLGTARPDIEEADVGQLNSIEFRARDGTKIPALLMRPKTVAGPAPTIVIAHGGPVARATNSWYDADVRWGRILNARGYNVIIPNFRGSGGFGHAWEKAGFGQWGQLMQTDLDDTAQSMVRAKIALPGKIAMFGWSYGGYAALASATQTDSPFACHVAGAGPSDLIEMLRWELRENGEDVREVWEERIGDPDRDADAIRTVSPALRAGNVTRPLMIIHGTKDDIVPIRQAEIMTRALRSAGKPAEYLELEDMGHSPDEEQRQKIADKMLAFLDKCLPAAGP
jgi:dipeptidyl aminopeptidase/acylaminoacyl peptidase